MRRRLVAYAVWSIALTAGCASSDQYRTVSPSASDQEATIRIVRACSLLGEVNPVTISDEDGLIGRVHPCGELVWHHSAGFVLITTQTHDGLTGALIFPAEAQRTYVLRVSSSLTHYFTEPDNFDPKLLAFNEHGWPLSPKHISKWKELQAEALSSKSDASGVPAKKDDRAPAGQTSDGTDGLPRTP